MAKKIAFMLESNGITEVLIDFKYYTGFAVSQKQKSIASMHNKIKESYGKKLLEISSKSPDELGKKISAFNLKVNIEENKKISLESFYQATKVFENGGPYLDLLDATPIKAKKDNRLITSGNLVSFQYKNKKFPIEPITLFYDWIYCRALSHYQDYIKELLKYEIFTDIEFNHEKSFNCQARSAAIFLLLYKKGILKDALMDIDFFSNNAYQNYKKYNNELNLID